jgi:hypothetical protein
VTQRGETKWSGVYCSVCGREVGKKKGAQVTLEVVCDKPICNYDIPASVNEQRDAYVIAAALGGVSVHQIAVANGVSRQRVYQIIDSWKQGV